MERDGGHLERESHQEQSDPQIDERIVPRPPVAQMGRDAGESRRTRGAVEQRNAVEEKGRGKGAQEQIFQGRLVRAHLPTQETGQDVERYGQRLETQEDHDEIRGRRHHHHTQDREEDHRVEFPPGNSRLLDVLDGNQDGEGGDAQEDHVEESREVVEDKHPAHHLLRCAEPPHQGEPCDHESSESHSGKPEAPPTADDEIQRKRPQRRPREEQERHGPSPVERRRARAHRPPRKAERPSGSEHRDHGR